MTSRFVPSRRPESKRIFCDHGAAPPVYESLKLEKGNPSSLVTLFTTIPYL